MTPDERAHLDAIISSPDDDLPRGVFADWLAERGEADRAEYIRLTLALPHLEREGRSDHWPKVHKLVECRHALHLLLHRHGLSSLDGLPRWPFPRDQVEAIWERGFVRGVICSGRNWLLHGDALMADNPIRDVTLTRGADACLIGMELGFGTLGFLLDAPSGWGGRNRLPGLLAMRWPRVKGWDLSLLEHHGARRAPTPHVGRVIRVHGDGTMDIELAAGAYVALSRDGTSARFGPAPDLVG